IKQAEVADLIVEESSVVSRQSSANTADDQAVTTDDSVFADDRQLTTDNSVFANGQRPTTNDRERKRVLGIRLRDGRTVRAQAVIITTGTFLNGLIHCGEQQYPAGRSGEAPAVLLGEALKKLGLRGCRLKTGTPPRLDGRTIDWSRFPVQPGDEDPTPF